MNQLTSLYLITPVIEAPSDFAEMLDRACSCANVAAILIRLAAADERTQINRLKILAPIAQKHNVAALVSIPNQDADLATIAARGGADGVHIDFDPTHMHNFLDRLKGERSLGVGGLNSRDDAMRSGEIGADYVMFGEPRPDGSRASPSLIADRAAWWAEIFETPCVVFAEDIASVEQMGRTGAEFLALGDKLWSATKDLPATINMINLSLERIAQERAETP